MATPLHVHQHEAEVFYLLAGTMDYEAGGELHHLGEAMIWLPQGVPHRFRVTGRRRYGSSASPCPPGSSASTGPSASPPRPASCPVPTRPSPSWPWRAAAPDHGLKVLGPPLPER